MTLLMVKTMAIILNSDKHNATGSHLRLSLLMFLGEDVANRETRAMQIVSTLKQLAQNELSIELVGEMFQADSRVSAYDAYRAAGIDHEDALAMVLADRKRAELLAKGRQLLKKSA